MTISDLDCTASIGERDRIRLEGIHAEMKTVISEVTIETIIGTVEIFSGIPQAVP